MQTAEYSPGLEGVIAGATTISFVNAERNSLMYRGYDIRDLVEHSNFEEVAFLLIKGHMPNKTEYEAFCRTLRNDRELPAEVVEVFKTFPKNSNPMDMLKIGTAMLGLSDPDMDAAPTDHEANVRKAMRMTAKYPALITYSFRINRGEQPVKPDASLPHSENFLYMLKGEKPDPYFTRVFDATQICYADHGFNASTFCARVTTSTLSDMYSGATAAVGTLKGPLHGGANEEAMKMLMEVGTPEGTEQWVMNALATKKKIMGFGHRAYKTGDPRAFILTEMAGELSKKVGNTTWHEMALTVERVMDREKNIKPNVDFPTAYLYYLMGLPIEIYTPLFALSRISGWTAHMIEQLDNNRLIRPKALYEGPQHVQYTPIEQR